MGVGVGLPEIKANSAQFQVKLPTGAELGKNVHIYFSIWIFVYLVQEKTRIGLVCQAVLSLV